MHYAFIDVDPSFCAQSASAGPMPAATRACSPPADTCWGNVVGVRNGRCDAETDKCVCRSGVSGATCEQTAQIVDVQTSGDEFGPSGVPLQQPLSISWRSDPMALPRVSILLRRRNAASTWPVPQYLAAGILNTNAWSWNVGSILEAGLEAGDSYSILVWASQHAYNESATFVLADPCAYTSCGDHGVCANGLCQCSAGFSGPSCGMGPCEAARCDPQHSSCNNTRVVTTGQFLSANVCALNASSTTCLAGYTGAQCRTPPACANLQCLNGGDIANAVQANGTCTGACDCRGNWIGEQCQTCGLHCRHGGSPNSGCTACAGCGAGYFGQTCECKFYSLGFRFNQDVSGWFNPASSGASPSLAQQRWTKTLAQDVLLAVSTVSNVRVDVSVDTIKQLAATRNSQAQVVVTLRLSLDCSTVGSFGGDDGADAPWSYMDYSPARGPSDELLALFTHERLALPYPRSQAGAFGRRLLQTAADETSDATLLATYNALLPLLQDRNSIVFQGQITSTMDPTWAVTAAGQTTQMQRARRSRIRTFVAVSWPPCAHVFLCMAFTCLYYLFLRSLGRADTGDSPRPSGLLRGRLRRQRRRRRHDGSVQLGVEELHRQAHGFDALLGARHRCARAHRRLDGRRRRAPVPPPQRQARHHRGAQSPRLHGSGERNDGQSGTRIHHQCRTMEQYQRLRGMRASRPLQCPCVVFGSLYHTSFLSFCLPRECWFVGALWCALLMRCASCWW